MTPLLLLLLLQEPAAEETPFSWQASLLYDYRTFSSERSDWHTITASVRRKFPWGSIALEGVAALRFDEWDPAIAVDAWADLWERGYGNLRLQGVPDADVLPRIDASAEIYQGLGDGWEFSAGDRFSDYREQDVHAPAISCAKYLGDWYLRARGTVVLLDGNAGVTGSLTARYYFHEEEFAEIVGGWGEELVALGADGAVDHREGLFVNLRIQKFFTPAFGVSVGAGLDDYERLPTGYGASIGIMVRW